MTSNCARTRSILWMALTILALPALAGANLLTNPGFEDAGGSLNGWSTYENAFISNAASDNIMRTGAAAGKAFGRFPGPSGFYQSFAPTPGQVVTFSGYSYVSSNDPIPGTGECTENRPLAIIVFYDSASFGSVITSNEVLLWDDNTAPDQWNTFSVSLVVPPGALRVEAHIQFYQPSFDRGAIFADDLSLTMAPPAAQPNVLVNPNFSSGLTGWSTFGSAFTESYPTPYSLPQSTKLFSSFAPNSDSGIFQTFATTPGTQWTLVVHAMTHCFNFDNITGNNTNEMRARIVFRDAGANEIGANEVVLIDNTAKVNFWKRHEVSAIAPAGAVTAQAFILFVSPQLERGSAYVDDLAFYAQETMQMVALNDVAQSEGVDELVKIPDLTTGVATLVGSLGDNFIETEALTAVYPVGCQGRTLPTEKGGSHGTLETPLLPFYAVDNDRLLQIDPLTGNGTVIGPIGFADVDGISIEPQTQYLWGITYASNQLIRIDRNSGAGTLVAEEVIVGRRLEDLAWSPTGQLYVLTSGPRIYQINPLTGEKINKWVLSGAQSMEALLWSLDGSTLYSTADRNGSKDLVTITLGPPGSETGTVQFVSGASSGFADLEGLAWLPSRTVVTLFSQSDPTDAQPLPRRTSLHQNTPNPFNPATRIAFELARGGAAVLRVYDAQGRQVATLLNKHLQPGSHEVTWRGLLDDGQQAPSGIYYYQLQTNDSMQSRKMILLK